MTVQSALSKIGVGKQSAKGSAVANPTFAHGVTSGAVLTVDVQQSLEDHTSGTRVSPAVNRTGVIAGIDFSSRVHAASGGLWILGALGTDNVTGTTPKSHACTVASALPYLTTFGELDGVYYSVQDVKIGDLAIKWQGNEPVEMSASGMGTLLTYPGTFTIGTDDTLAAYMRPAGGTFALDVDSGTPATAKVTGGEITISTPLTEIMLSGTITPDDIVEGKTEVECTFDIVPANLLEWRTIVTGSAAGTTAGPTTVYGSFSVVFTDGTYTLTLASSRVAFTVDFPDSDPGGGAVTLTLAGLCVQPAAGGTPITATMQNLVAAY